MFRSVLAAAMLLSAATAFAAPGDWVDAVKPISSPSIPGQVPLPVGDRAPGVSPHEGWAINGAQRMV